MRQPQRLLLATLLAMTLAGSATAEGDAPADPAPAFSVLAGSTISCSAAWPSTTFGCFWERPVLVLGGLELAIGLDAQTLLTGTLDDAHLAPYGILAYYADTWSAWAEMRLPELGGVSILGAPDWLRVGVTIHVLRREEVPP